MAKFTILGAAGFIGRHLAEHLHSSGHEVAAPRRGEACAREPGHLVYCVGVTADFRSRPFETVTSHISYLADILGWVRPLSFLYLSSTRVYGHSGSGVESASLALQPSNPDELYNATKIAGEALCLAQPNDAVRVARLSNVYGSAMDSVARPRDDFLAAVMREAMNGNVALRTAAESEKDYIAVEDVVRAVERVALHGRHRLYNVASGRNLTHRAITQRLATITGCKVVVLPNAPKVAYPPIDTLRIASEFRAGDPWSPSDLLERLPELIAATRAARLPEELVS